MTEPEFKNSQRLWKLIYAKHSFQYAQIAAQHGDSLNLASDDPLYYCLSVSVAGLYSIPFLKSNLVGSIPVSEFCISTELKGFHELLLTLRNKTYLHKDADIFHVECPEKVNDVRIIMEGDEIKTFTSSSLPKKESFFSTAISLCQNLLLQCEKKIDEIWDLPENKLPLEDGEYQLNVYDIHGPFLLKVKDDATLIV